jgi:hypothetical protein
MKTERITLSDGTPVRPGMIVVVLQGVKRGNPAGTVTKIVPFHSREIAKEHPSSIIVWNVRAVKSGGSTNDPLNHYFESLSDLRKATPEEKKEWRKFYRMYGPKKSDK